MRNIWIFLVFLIVSCSGINPLPTNKGGNPGNPATDTATDTTTTTTTTDNTQFRPCVLVEETEFKANTSQDLWKPSYYFTPPAKYPVDLTDAGLILKGNGYRGGVTNTPVERDISSCPSMAFRVQGTVNDQSLGGAGWDKRKAEKFKERVGEIVKQAEIIRKSNSQVAVVSLSQYLIDLFKLNLDTEMKMRFESLLRQRIEAKLDRVEFQKKVDVSRAMGGINLNRITAEKVSREVEIIMLIKFSD